MAKNFVIACPDDKTRSLPVGNNVAPGTPGIYAGQPGVCLTGSGDYAGTDIWGNATQPNKNHEPRADYGTVGFGGVALFAVTGVVAQTAVGVPVYITSAGVLTLTAASNTQFGSVYNNGAGNTATSCAVQIGVV